MTLYNLLFGENPLSKVVLEALDTTPDAVPRYRDAYYDAENDRLVIHTRTGGGNRDYYESEARCRHEYPEYFGGEDEPRGPWNSDLRALPGFLFDTDGDFDSTYADWFYKVPDAFRPIFEGLKELGAGGDQKPAGRWQKLFADMQAGEKTPETERALAVGERILGQITAAIDT